MDTLFLKCIFREGAVINNFVGGANLWLRKQQGC